ncbi:hypothetical protein C8F04DRAFT_1095102 [Mycena alexandri]|uniref:F-box domain-containing protein n=1 Tax=Mycena alexandri TaxID=1745969 RepID=A0AAD6X2K2_9AGAR|nr:hypothetical protein C8F04DRAFT_1095102 [Mycena alexandri]
MPTVNAIPRLPVELLQQIIDAAWNTPLSSNERVTLMRTSPLVNSTWAALFDVASSRDVYIPSAAFFDHFIRRLRGEPVTVVPAPSFLGGLLDRFRKPSKPAFAPTRSPNLACESITILLANPDVHPDKNGRIRLPMGAVLDELLETLDARSLAPNLRRLSIEYVDAGFDDVFQRVGLAALPPQITHLDLRYSFSPEMPSWLTESLRGKQEKQILRTIGWDAQSITRLSIVGAGENTIQDALAACPNTELLEVDGCETQLRPAVLIASFHHA